MSQTPERPQLLLIDDNRMRQASIAGLIGKWSSEHGMEIRQIRPGVVLKVIERLSSIRIILYSVGGAIIRSGEASGLLRVLHVLLPQVPVIIISDRDDSREIVFAYRIGCSGFIPTTMEPALALQAISFILNGGSFFPPSALQLINGDYPPSTDETEERDPELDDDNGGDFSLAPRANGAAPSSECDQRHCDDAVIEVGDGGPDERAGGMTNRQLDVLKCLKKGQPNKLIARELGLTEGTVKVHVRQIMRKLGALNRTQVAILTAVPELESPKSVPLPRSELN